MYFSGILFTYINVPEIYTAPPISQGVRVASGKQYYEFSESDLSNAIYVNGKAALNPKIMNIYPLIGLILAESNKGWRELQKQIKLLDVIIDRNMFLEKLTGQQANPYIIGGYELPMIKILMPP